jgi:hypothetical protein
MWIKNTGAHPDEIARISEQRAAKAAIDAQQLGLDGRAFANEHIAIAEAARNLSKSGKWEVGTAPNGTMYEVNLNTTPDRLLDWDAPLSRQPAARGRVADAFDARGLYERADALRAPTSDAWTGGQVVESVGMQNRPAMTERFREAGIPGIQYLDAGSRATSGGELLGVTQGPKGWQAKIRIKNRGGTAFADPTQQITTSRPFQTQADAQAWADSQINAGTRNYVMFDDKLIDILRRYGVAGTLGGGAAATSGTSE